VENGRTTTGKDPPRVLAVVLDIYGTLLEQAEAEGMTLPQFLKTLPPAEVLRIKEKVDLERRALEAEWRRLTKDWPHA